MPSEIYSSVSPTLDDIRTYSEKVKLFVTSLLVHSTGIQHNPKLKHILAASVLRFHDAFLGIIGNESSGKYKDPINHHFHQIMLSTLSETKISDQNFDKWKK